MSEDDALRERVLELVRRHGHEATSFQVLERGFHYWWGGDDACVAHADTGGAWVAAGAPLAPIERLADVTRGFLDAARRSGRRACFFGVERRFFDALDAAGSPRMRALLVGEQPTWDPTAWEEELRSAPSLREQLRRARAKNVVVRRAPPDEVRPGGLARRPMEDLVQRWLAGHAMPPMGFLTDVQPFDWPDERRYWLAEQDERLVGFLVAVPIPARSGWLIEDLMREPTMAPSGTAELLVDAAMRGLAAEGSPHVTLGLAALAGDVGGTLRRIRTAASLLYDFEGVRLFKAKLRPGAWEAIYLARPEAHGAVTAIRDVLTAFAHGSMLRFGLHALLRGPSLVIGLLAALLLPWTLALAFLAPDSAFPGAWVRWAWVAFDVALAGALLALARRWRQRLCTSLAVVVTADALVTWCEALAWNVPEVRSVSSALVVAVACGAPTLAALVLWHARRARGVNAAPQAARGR